MNKDQIKQLIAQGKIEKALKTIVDEINTIQDPQLKNDFLLQSSRLQRALREKNLGVTTDTETALTIDQVTRGVLALIDEVVAAEKILSTPEQSSQQAALMAKVSAITKAEISSLKEQNIPKIAHQLNLYEISKTNLEQAEVAAAKWGELAPPIIAHRISDERLKMDTIVKELKNLI